MDASLSGRGRGTIPDTDLYSTACAIQNLWLAARAEGLGIGWVSFYKFDDLRTILSIPRRADPIAYLCLGWPDEQPVRPSLETSGWASRTPLESVVMNERWQGPAGEGERGRTRAPDARRRSPPVTGPTASSSPAGASARSSP